MSTYYSSSSSIENYNGIIAVNSSGHQKVLLRIESASSSLIHIGTDAEKFELKTLISPVIIDVPQSDENYSWAVKKITGNHASGDGRQYSIYTSDPTVTSGEIRVQLISTDGNSVEYDSGRINWTYQKIGVSLYGYYPLYILQSDAEAASPSSSAHSHAITIGSGYDAYTSTYWMPDGLTMGIDQFHGNLHTAASYDFDSSDDSTITLYGGSERSQYGRDGYNFDPNQDPNQDHYAVISHSASHQLDSGPFSISIWFKHSGVNEACIFQKKSQNTEDSSEVKISINAGTVTFSLTNSSGTTFSASTYSYTQFNDDMWHQVVATLSSYGQMQIYVDSQNGGSSSVSGDFTLDSDIQIARSLDSSNNPEHLYGGMIDDLKIYTTDFSYDDVSYYYNNEAIEDPRLVPVLSADNGSGLGDILSVTLNLPSSSWSLNLIYIERENDYGGWDQVYNASSGTLTSHTISADDSNKKLRVAAEISHSSSGYVQKYSNEIQIGDLSVGLTPMERFGFWPVFLTEDEAKLYSPGDGSATGYMLGSQTYWMPGGLTEGVDSWAGTRGLLAGYSLDSDASSQTGSSFDGVISGEGLSFTSDSGRDCALTTSADSYITVNNSDFMFLDSNGNSDSFSVSLWAKLDPSNGGWAAFSGSAGAEDLIRIGTAGNKLFKVAIENDGSSKIMLSDGAYNANNNPILFFPRSGSQPVASSTPDWVHILVSVNRSAGTVHYYQNGVDITIDPHNNISGLGDMFDEFSSSSMEIGKNSNGWFIDDVKVYSRFIDADEASYIYNEGYVVDPATLYNVNLSMTDSYGDGWNGNVLYISDQPITTLSEAQGQDSSGNTLRDINGQVLTLPDLTQGSATIALSEFEADGVTPKQYYWVLGGGNFIDEASFIITTSDSGREIVNHNPSSASQQGTYGSYYYAGSFSTSGSGTTSSPEISISTLSSDSSGTITLSTTLNSQAASQAASWAVSLYPFNAAGSFWSGATFNIGQQVNLNVTSSGFYTVYVAAIDASGNIIHSTSSSIQVSVPSISIYTSSTPFVGDTLTLNIDNGGYSINSICWQRSDGSSWIDIVEDYSSYSNYTLVEDDNNKSIRAKLNLYTDSGSETYYSNPVNILGLNDGKIAKYVLSSDINDSYGDTSEHGSSADNIVFLYDQDAKNYAGRNVARITDGKFELPASLASSFTDAYTVSMWVKPSGFSYNQNYILSDKPGNDASSFDVYFDENGELLVVHRGPDNGLGTHGWDQKGWGSTTTISADSWSHIIISWNKSDGKITFYLNGSFVSESVMQEGPWDSPAALRVGNNNDFVGYEGFQGSVADLVIWSGTSLNSDEAARLYANGWESELGPTMYQIPNDDTSLTTPSADSGWDKTTTYGTIERRGLTEYYVTEAGQPMESRYLVSGNTTPYQQALGSVKTYDNLVSHNYLRVKFDYYAIHRGTEFSVSVDGEQVWSSAVDSQFEVLDDLTGGQIQSGFTWSTHQKSSIEFLVPHTASSATVQIDIHSAYSHTRYAFSPVEIYIDAPSSAVSSYSVDLLDSDKFMVFVNGLFVSSDEYALSSGTLTFSQGFLSVGDEIMCVKVT